MPGKESYYINSEGADLEALRKALRWALSKNGSTAFLAVHGLRNLDGVVRDILGEGAVKSLKSSGQANVSGKRLVVVTERKKIYDGQGAPMIAAHPSRDFLDELDSIPNLSALLVLPWMMKEVEEWIKTRNAVELESGQRAQVTQLVNNKVVEQALKSLSESVNVSTGVVHPRDRNRAIETFRILRDSGELFTPELVKAWLIAEGRWEARHAQEAAELARQIIAGKNLRSETAWAPNILDIWREEAKKAG